MAVELIKFLWLLRLLWPEVISVEVSKSGLGADLGTGFGDNGGGERGESRVLVFSSKDLLLCRDDPSANVSTGKSGLCVEKDDDVRGESWSYEFEPCFKWRCENASEATGCELSPEDNKALARQLLLIFESDAMVLEPFSFSA